MLSLHQQTDRLRYADNLVPTLQGGMATRPGANQTVSGDISDAAPWGNRKLLEKNGRLVLWDGTETDIAPAGRQLQATAFQALTSNANREDRLYVADGINPLWYIAYRSGAYAKYEIENSVLDANNIPYAIPVAQAVATWRGRLWIAFGTNRAQHCQFDDTDAWDPLWTVECQGEAPDHIIGFKPSKEVLFAGLGESIFQITGDSQFNWDRNQIAETGIAGPDAMEIHDQTLYWISRSGIHQSGVVEPLSEDIREAFGPSYPSAIVADRSRRLLLCLVFGRLFVMHLSRPGYWGEITGHLVIGLIRTADYTGWYGSDGAWFLGSRDMPDQKLDGTLINFTSLFDTWDVYPNAEGSGRAALPRTQCLIAGSPRGNATYRVSADGKNSFETTATLTDEQPDMLSDEITGLKGEPWPTRPVRREFAAQLSGQSFRHKLSAPCYMEVLEFNPQYRFGEEDD